MTSGDPQPVRLLCAVVAKGALEADVIPAFEAAGGAVAVEWAPTGVIMGRIDAGVRADAVLVLADAMDRLVARGLAAADTRVTVFRSRVAIAVSAGTPHPPIGTVEAL